MKYFYEKNTPNYKIGTEIKSKLYSKKNKYQKIEIFKTSLNENLLAIDGETIFTNQNEYVFSESMAHFSLFSHPNPEKVLIIGGGDGAILKEVLKHKRVQFCYLLEQDESLLELSQEYFKEFDLEKHLKSKKVKLYLESEQEFLNKFQEYFDVIIINNKKNVLKSFYKKIDDSLAKDGIIIQKIGNFLFEKQNIKKAKTNIESVFDYSELFTDNYQNFYILASQKIKIKEISLRILNIRFKQFKEAKNLKYYSPEIYIASKKIPRYQKDFL